MKQIFSSNRGFTLLEVLLASVILGTSLLVVMRAMGSSITALHRSQNALTAIQFLDQKAREVEQLAYESDGEKIGATAGTFETKRSEFEWRLSRQSGGKDAYYDVVGMEVTWKERGKDRIRSSEIYVYHPPKTQTLL